MAIRLTLTDIQKRFDTNTPQVGMGLVKRLAYCQT